MMFRPGNTYIRPKFGIYRRIFHMTSFGLPDMGDLDRTPREIMDSHMVRAYLNESINPANGLRETAVLYAYFEMDKLVR
jgi:hypothetical protein